MRPNIVNPDPSEVCESDYEMIEPGVYTGYCGRVGGK